MSLYARAIYLSMAVQPLWTWATFSVGRTP
jgi:hypothetical protein